MAAPSSVGVHTAGFTHNDIKENNICVDMTAAEPVVTVIDLGMVNVPCV